MATYAIGDIQGCYHSLRRLLASARFSPGRDRLWCVGDLINRGPRSLETLRFLQDIEHSLTIVLGNHDLHFLSVYFAGASPEPKHTLDALLEAPDCDALAHWLRRQPLAHAQTVETITTPRRFLMVHAGVAPQWTLPQTLALAGEAEEALQGRDHVTALQRMYGDEPACWHDSLTGYDRLRVIINYLTRMRFCSADGHMELGAKGPPDNAPAGCRPWFAFQRITPAAELVFGHWAALEGRTGLPHIHGLDTGCVWGKRLTMMRLEDRRYFSVEAQD